MRFLIKIIITALVVAGVSEIGRRSSTVAAVLASLPLTSILTLTWLYLDTSDATKVSALSMNIFWCLLPSLLFLLMLPWLLKAGMKFPAALGISVGAMVLTYPAFLWFLAKIGVDV